MFPSRFRYYEINLNTFNKLTSAEYSAKSNITCELDLADSYEKIYGGYSENTQRNIKRAHNNHLTITKDVTISDLIELFRQYRGKTIKNLKTRNYKTLTGIVQSAIHKKKAQIIGVKTKENNTCAGAVFLADKRKFIFLFSAASNEAKSNGAMSFLIDHFIRENAQQNLILDFEGSNNPDLARFYKSFGSKECVYLQVKKNQLPWYVKWLKN